MRTNKRQEDHIDLNNSNTKKEKYTHLKESERYKIEATLLKLPTDIIETVEALGYPMPKRCIIERRLRSIVKLPSEKQRAITHKFKINLSNIRLAE